MILPFIYMSYICCVNFHNLCKFHRSYVYFVRCVSIEKIVNAFSLKEIIIQKVAHSKKSYKKMPNVPTLTRLAVLEISRNFHNKYTCMKLT